MEDNNEKQVAAIPYFIHEGEVSRMEREHKDAMEKMDPAVTAMMMAATEVPIGCPTSVTAWAASPVTVGPTIPMKDPGALPEVPTM